MPCTEPISGAWGWWGPQLLALGAADTPLQVHPVCPLLHTEPILGT